MRHFFGPSALCLVVLVWTSPVFAQGPSRRPYRALFGTGYSETTQMLRASGTAGIGYATDVAEEYQGFGGRAFRDGVAHFSGALSYALQRNGLTVSALAAGRYSPSAPNNFVPHSAARVSFRQPLGHRISASASASVTYRPYSYGSVFLGTDESDEDVMPGTERTPGRKLLLGDVDAIEVIPVTVEDDDRESEWDLAANSAAYVNYTAGASFSHRLSNRTGYGFHYGYRLTPGANESSEFERQSVGAEIHHAVGRGLSVRGGYSYGESHRGIGPTHSHHMIDAGVNYGRPLSISRRTTLSFSTGSYGRQTSNNNPQFRMTGRATLNHELGQTWWVSGSIGRSVLVYEQFDDPVVRDGLTVRLHGLITRRVNFSGSAHAGLGSIGLEGGAPAFHAVHAAASVGIAINQFMRGSVVYSYYMHRFDEEKAMASGTPFNLTRHSVRGLVNVSAPLFYRVGRSNASR